MAEFTAINVGEGDSFYFVTDNGYKVLFDGGKSKTGFFEKFRNITGENCVDIMVCSHCDEDHVNGLINFLKHPSSDCAELWIPANVTSKLKELVCFPEYFYEQLIQDIEKVDFESNNFNNL